MLYYDGEVMCHVDTQVSSSSLFSLTSLTSAGVTPGWRTVLAWMVTHSATWAGLLVQQCCKGSTSVVTMEARDFTSSIYGRIGGHL